MVPSRGVKGVISSQLTCDTDNSVFVGEILIQTLNPTL